MKNTVILFSLLLFILAAAGCIGSGEGDSGSGLIGGSFAGGDSAIKLSFVENAPPQEVTAASSPTEKDGQEFGITIRLDNSGEFTIPAEGLSLSLSGFFPSDFNKVAADLVHKSGSDTEIRGVTLLPDGSKVSGDTYTYTFSDLSYQNVIQGDQTFPLRVDTCYQYQTNVLSQICLMKDFRLNRERSTCKPTESKQVSNSGAPVKVTNVYQTALGKNKFQLNFDVERVGSGNIFLNGCEDATFANKNKVQVTVNPNLKNSIESMNCLGLEGGEYSSAIGAYAGTLLMSGGKGSFTCIQELKSGAVLASALKSIELSIDYSVSDFVETEILVKHFI